MVDTSTYKPQGPVKDANGASLTRTETFGFTVSPAGKHPGKFVIQSHPSRGVSGSLSPVVTRGKGFWSGGITERDHELDDEVAKEWEEQGIKGRPKSVIVAVNIPGSLDPAPDGRKLAWEMAKQQLKDKYPDAEIVEVRQ